MQRRLTVAEYLDRWLKGSVRGSVRRGTYQSYRRQARRYITPAVGRVGLNALTPAHVQGLYREMQDRGLSRALSDGEFTTPKTKRSRRRIDLSAGSVAALKRHRMR